MIVFLTFLLIGEFLGKNTSESYLDKQTKKGKIAKLVFVINDQNVYNTLFKDMNKDSQKDYTGLEGKRGNVMKDTDNENSKNIDLKNIVSKNGVEDAHNMIEIRFDNIKDTNQADKDSESELNKLLEKKIIEMLENEGNNFKTDENTSEDNRKKQDGSISNNHDNQEYKNDYLEKNEDKMTKSEDYGNNKPVEQITQATSNKVDPTDRSIENKIDKRKSTGLEDRIELFSIPLGYQSVCLILANYSLLKNESKNKKIKIKNILFDINGFDAYNVIKFNKIDDKYVDESGYFEGVPHNDTFEFKNFKTSTGFLSLYASEESQRLQNYNLRKLIQHLAQLKKKSVKDLLQEKCSLSVINRVIFDHLYLDNKDFFNVCVCIDSFCGDCKGIFQVKNSDLIIK